MKNKSLILAVGLCCLAFAIPHTKAAAQEAGKTTVSGRITDAETSEPLENVNVFLSVTTIGASTGSDGRFRIVGIPAGIFDLVISRVGYERQTITLKILAAESLYYDIKLKPRMVQAGEVQVSAAEPGEWKDDLKIFVKEFLGETDNAAKCAILNPEVLNFTHDKKTNMLAATSDSILRVDNMAFGYRIYLVLVKFEWNLVHGDGRYFVFSMFQELTPRDGKEDSVWMENRRRSYRGSLKQFLWAVNAGKAEDEKFYIYAGSKRLLANGIPGPGTAAMPERGHLVSPDELVSASESGSPFKTLQFNGVLRVEYWNRTPQEVSWLTLDGPFVMIDTAGNLLNPLSLEVAGQWSGNRVAELLPRY
jgi:hypothetical protein